MEIFKNIREQKADILKSNIPDGELGFIDPSILRLRSREMRPTLGRLFALRQDILPREAIENYILYFGITEVMENIDHHLMVFKFYINIMTNDDEIITFSFIEEGIDITKALRLGILIKKINYDITSEKTAEFLTSDEWELFKTELISSAEDLYSDIEIGGGASVMIKILNKYKTKRVLNLFKVYEPKIKNVTSKYALEIISQRKILKRLSFSGSDSISDEVINIISGQGLIMKREVHIESLRDDLINTFNNSNIDSSNNELDSFILSSMA